MTVEQRREVTEQVAIADVEDRREQRQSLAPIAAVHDVAVLVAPHEHDVPGGRRVGVVAKICRSRPRRVRSIAVGEVSTRTLRPTSGHGKLATSAVEVSRRAKPRRSFSAGDVAAGREVREHVVALAQRRAQQSQPAGAVFLRDAPRTEIAYTLLSAIDLAIRVEGQEGTDDPAVGPQHEPVIGLLVGPSWIHGSPPRRRRDPRVHPALQKLRDRGHLGFGDRQYLDGTVARHGAKVRQTPRQQKSSTMTSIVIAAHNEETVIGRCLDTLLADAHPGEFDVTVVANGCSDRTAEVAGTRAGVRGPRSSRAAWQVERTQCRRHRRARLPADLPRRRHRREHRGGAMSGRRADRVENPPAAVVPRRELDL